MQKKVYPTLFDQFFYYFIVFLCDNFSKFLRSLKSGLRFALEPLVLSEKFGSVFPKNTEPKLRYSVHSVRSYTVYNLSTGCLR